MLNILIRTHRRPGGFKRMMQSIEAQTYKNYKVYVSVDDDLTYQYVAAYGIDENYIVRIDRDNLDGLTPKSDAPYNLYFNLLLAKVKSGYVYCVDDDDILFDESSLSAIAGELKDKQTLYLFKMLWFGSGIPAHSFGIKPTAGDIGTPCFCCHIGLARKAVWGGGQISDWEYINELHSIAKEVKWVDKIVYNVIAPSGGKSEL